MKLAIMFATLGVSMAVGLGQRITDPVEQYRKRSRNKSDQFAHTF